MPKTRRTPQISTRLAGADFIQFELLCRLEGKTKTELARKAIQWYLANHEKLVNEERDAAVVQSLKSIEDRLAGIMVKVGIEVCSMNHLFWTRTDEDVRKQLFAECWSAGVKRMKNKLKPDEEALRGEMRTQKGREA